MPAFIDLTGQRFGRLIVIEVDAKAKSGNYKWLCLCDCSKSLVILGASLRAGRSKSCGCFQRDNASIIHKNNQYSMKHGYASIESESKAYIAWCGMRQRCTNHKNKRYRDYGGRGITVCKRWQEFVNFLEDMGEPPTDKHQIERIDNDKGYNKSNCCWATPKQNCRNRRNNRMISFNGITQCMSAWADKTGLHRNIIAWRLDNGWSIKRALQTPVKKYKKRKTNG